MPYDPDASEMMAYAEAVAYLVSECPDSLDPIHEYGSSGPVIGYAIRYTVCGDYGGGLMYESNAQILLEDHPWITRRYMDHDTTDVVLWTDSDSGPIDRWHVESLAETLRRLEDYPIIDDEHYYMLRDERTQAAYNDERRYLLSAIDDLLADGAPDYMEPDSDALLEWAEDEDQWWDVREAHIEHAHGQTYVDTGTLAAVVVEWAREDGPDAPPLYRLAPWADQTHPDFDTSEAFACRVSAANRRLAEIDAAYIIDRGYDHD